MKPLHFWVGLLGSILLPSMIYGYSAAQYPQNYADSSELMTAAYVGGVAHPPGYPLYTAFLGWWMHLTVGLTPAHLANLSSTLFQSLSLGVLYLILGEFLLLIGEQASKRLPEKKSHQKMSGLPRSLVNPLSVLVQRGFKAYVQNPSLKTAVLTHLSPITSLIALVTTLFLAFSYHFWFHALIAEVFPLNHLFTGLILWVGLTLYRIGPQSRTPSPAQVPSGHSNLWRKSGAYLLAGLLGLATSHHQTILFLLPGLLVFAWSRDCTSGRLSISHYLPKIDIHRLFAFWPYLLTFAITLLLPMVLMYQLDAHQAPFSWQIEPGVQGLWDFLARNVYGAEGSAIETDVHQWNLPHSWYSLGIYLQLLEGDFTGIGIFLAGWGLVYTIARHRRLGCYLLITLALTGPLLAAYLKFPILEQSNDNAYYWGMALRWRMFLLHEYLLALPMGVGLLAVFCQWYGVARKLKLRCIPIACLLLLPLWMGTLHVGLVETRAQALESQLYQEMLDQLPPKAVVLVDSDHVFGLIYQQLVENRREDVWIIPTTLEMRGWYIQQLEPPLTIFDHSKKSGRLADIVSWNLFQDRYVYLLGLDFDFLEDLGVEANPFYAVPAGYMIEISRLPQRISAGNYQISQQLIDRSQGSTSDWERGFAGDLATTHTILGWYFAKAGLAPQADQHFALAKKMVHLTHNLKTIEQTQQGSQTDVTNYLSATNISSFQYEDWGNQALHRLDLEAALVYFRKSLFLEPFNLHARQQLVEVLIGLEQEDAVVVERHNLNQVLKHILPTY